MIERKLVTEAGFDAMVLDVCYDRGDCKALGIDYCNITGQDVDKIRTNLLKQYEVKG